MTAKPTKQSNHPSKRGGYLPVGDQKGRVEIVALGPKAARATARKKRPTSSE